MKTIEVLDGLLDDKQTVEECILYQVMVIYEGAVDEERVYTDLNEAWDYYKQLEAELDGHDAFIYLDAVYLKHGDMQIDSHIENIDTMYLGDN